MMATSTPRYGFTIFATFITPRNIETLLSRWKLSGEYGGGVALRIPDMVVVPDLSPAALVAAVEVFDDLACKRPALARERSIQEPPRSHAARSLARRRCAHGRSSTMQAQPRRSASEARAQDAHVCRVGSSAGGYRTRGA